MRLVLSPSVKVYYLHFKGRERRGAGGQEQEAAGTGRSAGLLCKESQAPGGAGLQAGTCGVQKLALEPGAGGWPTVGVH